MSRNRRLTRRRGCRRNRRVNQAGGEGMAYRFAGSVDPTNPSLGNAAEVLRFPSCNEAVRPGYLADAQIKGGLPGFAGGARRRSAFQNMLGGRRSTALPMTGGRGAFTTGATQVAMQGIGAPLSGGFIQTVAAPPTAAELRLVETPMAGQKGGRFTNEFNVVGASKIALMEPSYSGCGDGLVAQQNPLNKGELSSLITAPPPLVPTPSPGSGDVLQKGGRKTRSRRNRKCWTRRNRRQSGGVGGVDSMVYEAPRSGYTHTPSNSAGGDAGTLADGKTPFLVNVPYTAQPHISATCLKTGGGLARKSSRGRKDRKSRKTRRNGRK